MRYLFPLLYQRQYITMEVISLLKRFCKTLSTHLAAHYNSSKKVPPLPSVLPLIFSRKSSSLARHPQCPLIRGKGRTQELLAHHITPPQCRGSIVCCAPLRLLYNKRLHRIWPPVSPHTSQEQDQPSNQLTSHAYAHEVKSRVVACAFYFDNKSRLRRFKLF